MDNKPVKLEFCENFLRKEVSSQKEKTFLQAQF